jgi:hypothetical protein
MEWKKVDQKGECPSARSGHTFNWIGGYNYLLFGGIEDAKNGKIAPTSDLYTMKMGPSKYRTVSYKLFSFNKTSPNLVAGCYTPFCIFQNSNKKRFHIFEFMYLFKTIKF